MFQEDGRGEHNHTHKHTHTHTHTQTHTHARARTHAHALTGYRNFKKKGYALSKCSRGKGDHANVNCLSIPPPPHPHLSCVFFKLFLVPMTQRYKIIFSYDCNETSGSDPPHLLVTYFQLKGLSMVWGWL